MSATPLLAQTTWQGLRFGMSASEASACLGRKSFQVTQVGTEQHYAVSPDLQMTLPGVKRTVPLKADLLFDGGRLSIVRLSLDTDEIRKGEPKISMLVLAAALPESIYEQIVGKYGPSAFQSGSCSTVSLSALRSEIQSCRSTWKAPNQLIRFGWFYSSDGDKLTLELQYKALVEGL